jgi:hypothetical protein
VFGKKARSSTVRKVIVVVHSTYLILKLELPRTACVSGASALVTVGVLVEDDSLYRNYYFSYVRTRIYLVKSACTSPNAVPTLVRRSNNTVTPVIPS